MHRSLWIASPSGLIAAFLAGSACAADPSFDSYWHDGKAELDGYRLTISRYGEPRHGQAALVYVTEPFSESKRVKVDDPKKNPADTFDAFKLNLVRDFQTGIYDYNTMVSVFVRSATLEPVKISLSSAEWCGHVYEELLFGPRTITGQYISYFEGETTKHKLPANRAGLVEDELWIRLRGLRGEFLPPGKRKSFPFLPGTLHSRLAHKPLSWTTVEIERATATEPLEVPAGKFETTRYTVKIADGRAGTFFVEQAYPRRIIRWELLPDIRAELAGSARLEYWKLHRNGDESYLNALGLAPLPTR